MTDALTHRRRASSRECVPDRRWTCDACWTSRITIRYNHARADRVSPCTRLYRRIRYPVIYRIYSETGSFAPRTIDAPRNLSVRSGRLRTITVRAEHAADALFVAAPCPSTPRRGPTPRTEVCARQFAVVRQASSSTARTPKAEAPICRFLTRRDVVRGREPLGPASLDLPGDAWRYDPPAVYFGLMRSSHTR